MPRLIKTYQECSPVCDCTSFFCKCRLFKDQKGVLQLQGVLKWVLCPRLKVETPEASSTVSPTLVNPILTRKHQTVWLPSRAWRLPNPSNPGARHPEDQRYRLAGTATLNGRHARSPLISHQVETIKTCQHKSLLGGFHWFADLWESLSVMPKQAAWLGVLQLYQKAKSKLCLANVQRWIDRWKWHWVWHHMPLHADIFLRKPKVCILVYCHSVECLGRWISTMRLNLPKSPQNNLHKKNVTPKNNAVLPVNGSTDSRMNSSGDMHKLNCLSLVWQAL